MKRLIYATSIHSLIPYLDSINREDLALTLKYIVDDELYGIKLKDKLMKTSQMVKDYVITHNNYELDLYINSLYNRAMMLITDEDDNILAKKFSQLSIIYGNQYDIIVGGKIKLLYDTDGLNKYDDYHIVETIKNKDFDHLEVVVFEQ